MVSPASRTDADPTRFQTTLQLLRGWASRPSAETDLEEIFGPSLDWPAAYRLLHAFRVPDFSVLPPVTILDPSKMPGLWGGYSRDLNRIFLSSDLPADELPAVLLEEIGHFLDAALCATETPGDEGAIFANRVLGSSRRPEDETGEPMVRFGHALIPVEAARKSGGSGKRRSRGKKGRGKNGSRNSFDSGFESSNGGGDSGNGAGFGDPGDKRGGLGETIRNGDTARAGDLSPNYRIDGGIVYALGTGVRIEQVAGAHRLIGSGGNDTFVVTSPTVAIEDFGGSDTVETQVSYSLEKHGLIENLVAAPGTAPLALTGNSTRANRIVGNDGNNLLDGGLDALSDTLIGGGGDDSYVLRDTLDNVVELPGGGIDTILTNSTAVSLSDYANVEGLAFTGTVSGGVSFTGNSLNNLLTGTAGNDSLNGAAGIDTMIGGAGNDSYRVDNNADVVLEVAGQGRDTVISTAPHATLAGNVEILRLAGEENISGTGNALNNSLYGNNSDNSLHGLDGDDLVVGDGQLPGLDFTGRKVSEVGRSYLVKSTNALINGLGTPDFIVGAGSFGERTLTRNDDGSSSRIDLTQIFGPNGLNLYGQNIRSMFVNTNGNITFNSPLSTFTPDEISAGEFPIIAPFWADVDTRGGRTTASSGGNSTGSNLIYYDVDDEARVLTVTWDDVGYFPNRVDKVNAFQLQIIDSGDGNAFVIYRYENIDWTTGSASGGTDGLGGQAARAGFNSGTGVLLEFPQSGDDQSMLTLDQAIPRQGLDSGRAGVFIFEIRNGEFVDNFGGNDWLFGGRGNDTLLGSSGSDTLLGEAGNDRLDGGLGADSMVGGFGDDVYVVDNSKDAVVEKPNEGTDTVESGISYTLQGGSSVEVLLLTGTADIRGTGNELNNTLIGNTGNNALFGRDGNDSLDGGLGRDELFGENGSDTLQGGANDNAADSLAGGLGDDFYLVDSTIDFINDVEGSKDRIITSVTFSLASSLVSGVEILELADAGKLDATGNSLANTLIGNSVNNSLDGGNGEDYLLGGAGEDTLNGGTADNARDTLEGGTGDDLYILDSSLDTIEEKENEGLDTVLATFSVDLSSPLVTGIENLTLSENTPVDDSGSKGNGTGNSLANVITGNSGNNALDGRGGSDQLFGKGGNDIFQGGANDGVSDTLVGGEGDDLYRVDAHNLNFSGLSTDVDFISDAGGKDTVESAASYDLTASNLSGSPIETLLYSDKDNRPATLRGNAENNLIRSFGTGADLIEAGKGNDSLDGGLGANILVGGDGNDLYTVNSSEDIVVERKNEGLDEILVAIAGNTVTFDLDQQPLGLGDTVSHVEIISYQGAGEARLLGSASNNTIRGGSFQNTLAGRGGDDYLEGNTASDSLDGGLGDDTLDGRGGNDILKGGSGNDFYYAPSQSTNIIEESGEGTADTVRSTVDFSLSFAPGLLQVENLLLWGNETQNLLGIGNELNNSISGNDGANTLSGGLSNTGATTGNDTILGGLGSDLIFGLDGNDSLVGGGSPQGDLPADLSTPVTIAKGQSYVGTIDLLTEDKIDNRDVDWIRVNLKAGEDHIFTLTFDMVGAAAELQRTYMGVGRPRSALFDLIDGAASVALVDKTASPFSIPDEDYYYSYWWYNWEYADDIADKKFVLKIRMFTDAEVYIPVFSDGPATGTYKLTFPSGSDAVTNIIADNASNTLVGGVGSDTLVSGNGRDREGKYFGDILLGGTNGIPGLVDTDTASDSLVGGSGDDVLDGGIAADTMIGGKGNDTYFVDHIGDKVTESADGGTSDLLVGQFKTSISNLSINNLYDVNLETKYAHVEHASLIGAAALTAMGNRDGNSLIGNLGDNTLDGAGGDDTLLGGGGNDSLHGAAGQDYLDGQNGTNTLVGGQGSDTYIINDRDDRIRGEEPGILGGVDLVRTNFNFDPIQGLGVDPVTGQVINDYQPNFPDNSPSITKSQSFASRDLDSFFHLENFDLIGDAAYGVGNSLDNVMKSGILNSLVIGHGGNDSLIGIQLQPSDVFLKEQSMFNDSLFGDTPDFYASPDLYASAPFDTQNQKFITGIGKDKFGNDYLSGGIGDDYLDGGRSFDSMIGGVGNDTFIQDHIDDYVDAVTDELFVSNNLGKVSASGQNELVSSVNIKQAPDGISKLMLVVANQDPSSGQAEVASIGSFANSKLGNNRTFVVSVGGASFVNRDANHMEVMYAPRELATGVSFSRGALVDDLNNPGKKQIALSWTAGADADQSIVGYTVRFKRTDKDDIWHTYVKGSSQDFQGTSENPTLIVRDLENGIYEFSVHAVELAIPALQSRTPNSATHVTLQGGAGNDAVIGTRITRGLPGPQGFDLYHEVGDFYTNPLIWNNPIAPLPLGFIFNPLPTTNIPGRSFEFATYLDGGFGNDFLNGAAVYDRTGDDYTFKGVKFRGLNTLVGGQGSDTFVVKNGGTALGDEFDWVVKYGNETPVDYGAGGVGNSLNGGQHNLVVSTVPFLSLSDSVVHQGQFIDRLNLVGVLQFGMGNRLDNYIYETSGAVSSLNTLVGNTGRDSIVGNSRENVLVGGTAYGTDNVGLAVRDFAAIQDGGNGLTTSIFRDTDPVPTQPNGIGVADPSQFWFVPGYYGEVFDPNRNRDTLVAFDNSTLDGGVGNDSLVGSETPNSRGDNFFVSKGQGGDQAKDIIFGDAVFGNGGNDTVTFTDSDTLWWSAFKQGDILPKNRYEIAGDISNLVLQMGSPTAREAYGNRNSIGNENLGEGGNRIVGNEFDNVLTGGGVGGFEQKGSGVDFLTGNAGRDNFHIDVQDRYFNENSYRNSTSNEWRPAIRITLAATRHEWIKKDSVYKDFDYVVVTDFETVDNLRLNSNLSEYSIGNLPQGLGGPGGDVGPKGKKFTSNEFGIYYTGGTFDPGLGEGQYSPNLIAVIQSPYDLLGPLEDKNSDGRWDGLVARPSSPSLIQDSPTSISPPFMGWGDLESGFFYELASSPFAAYINKTYNPENSLASLTSLARSGNDMFTGGAAADLYNGYGGNDSLLGGANNDTLLGGSGLDRLFGQAGDDSLLGEIGDDYLDGGTGNDQMIGGVGNDTYVVDSLTDVVIEQLDSGTDQVFVSVSGYILAANVEHLTLDASVENGTGNGLNNSLVGNSVANSLTGFGGNDTLIGGDGIDTFDGGTGNDVYFVDSQAETILDSAGVDTVFSSVSYDLSGPLVAGGTGIEHLRLTTGINSTLVGNNADNMITGNIGGDSISGGVGNDTLTGTSADGYAEIDTLSGGTGADLFILANRSALFYNVQPGAGDYAVITDFSVADGDKLQLLSKNSLPRGVGYVLSQTDVFGVGIPTANTYLYRDDGNGAADNLLDNLVAVISATGGSGVGGGLTTSDLDRVATYA